MSRLRIFVASSCEARIEDMAVRRILEDYDIEPVSWRDTFNPGEFGLETLIKITQKIHGAVIISTPDDKVWYRGSESLAPRDNVLFEMGLFIKAMGLKHVALIFVKDDNGVSPKMPTDIHGLNVILFEKDREVANEAHLVKWIHKFKQFSHPMYFHLSEAVRILQDNFHKIPESWIDEIKNYILHPFENMSIGALQGEFFLNTTQYYDSVLSKLSNSDSSTTIRAISYVAPEVWNSDPHQKRFLEYNVEAKKNGATIRRLFVATDEQISEHWAIIEQQVKAGFEIKTVNPRIFSEYSNLDDSIIFERRDDLRCYKTIQFYDNPYKLKGAKLHLNVTFCKEQINSFDTVWRTAKAPGKRSIVSKRGGPPPGVALKSYQLTSEVVTCVEAAAARNIPLCNELKTLILETPSGLIAAHIPGDSELCLREVKNILEIKDVKIADPSSIERLGLFRGTVSAVLNPVWDMPHLISKRLLSLDFVMTNNGTKTGYFKFDPVILLNAKSTITGNFEKGKTSEDN
ncbi:MAG: TIR domain-containing protein [Pyrinomonadaceae bacterium]